MAEALMPWGPAVTFIGPSCVDAETPFLVSLIVPIRPVADMPWVPTLTLAEPRFAMAWIPCGLAAAWMGWPPAAVVAAAVAVAAVAAANCCGCCW